MADLVRALRHRNYRLFFAGQLTSLTGTWMQSVAQSWLVYRLTDSPAQLGAIGFASQIPVFLLAPLGGAVADRYARRDVLIVTQVAAMILAFALAALTLSGRVEVWHVYLLAAITGVVTAFDMPTRQSFVVDMVGREDLVNAIALNSSIFNGARTLGPAVAGVLVGVIGEGWCFFLNGVSFLAVIAGLLLMRIDRPAPAPVEGSAVARIREGFAYVAATMPIRSLLVLLGMLSLVGMPYTVLMPIFADDILGGGATGLGVLMGASGLGALAGALLLAARTGLRGLSSWVAAAAFGFGLALVLFSLSTRFWLSVVLLLPIGLFNIVAMASSNTLIQSMVPDHLRGRVMAVYSMMFMGMAPLGALGAGTVAGRLGAPATVAIGGVACMIGAGLFYVRLSTLKVHARRLILAQQAAGGEPSQGTTGQQSPLVPKEQLQE
jgi:MFS family permease